MYRDFYLELSDDVIALCEELLRRAEEWHLPIKRKENFVGFGKIHGFYMFWIARKDGADYFKARAAYAREQSQEIAYYPLAAENKGAVLAAAEAIYREYLAYGEGAERQKLSRERSVRPRKASGAPVLRGPWQESAQRAAAAWREALCEIVLAEDAAPAQAARDFSAAAESLLRHLGCEIRLERTKSVWERYVLGDGETLESIGADYDLTRERIRQLVKKGSREVASLFAERLDIGTDDTVSALVLEMTRALESACDNLPAFAQSIFADWGEQKIKVSLKLLLGEKNAAELWEMREAYKKAVRNAAARKEESPQMLLELTQLIRYPTEVYADTEEQISAFVMEKEYTYVANFRRRLEKMQEHLRFIQKPNIVYYSTSKTDHRPDFLLELENGRRALVLVLPTINMAFSYNAKRFQALRDFCERKGYGYLIVDDRGQTLWGLECLLIDPALKSALDAILLSKGEILWSDILEAKKAHEITNPLIAAYVLQNGLHFVVQPYFCVRSSSREMI